MIKPIIMLVAGMLLLGYGNKQGGSHKQIISGVAIILIAWGVLTLIF